MSKSKFVEAIATRLGVSKSEASKFVDAYAEASIEALKAEGETTLPGLVKVALKDIPAKPERQGINPFTKQPVTIAAKPATKKVKVRPIAHLKKAVLT